MELEILKELLIKEYPYLKIINSSKKTYKAIHLYFKEDNYSFPWELQIWNKTDEFNNIESHEKYKQDYIRWEEESKGGK